MKEAAGEANLTVVAIILIGVVVAVVTPLVTNLMSSSAEKACCTDAGGIWKNGQCNKGSSAYSDADYRKCVSNATSNQK